MVPHAPHQRDSARRREAPLQSCIVLELKGRIEPVAADVEPVVDRLLVVDVQVALLVLAQQFLGMSPAPLIGPNPSTDGHRIQIEIPGVGDNNLVAPTVEGRTKSHPTLNGRPDLRAVVDLLLGAGVARPVVSVPRAVRQQRGSVLLLETQVQDGGLSVERGHVVGRERPPQDNHVVDHTAE